MPNVEDSTQQNQADQAKAKDPNTEAYRALTSMLQEQYPGAFPIPRKPLKIGIGKDIAAARPEIDRDLLSKVLRWWTTRIDYHVSVACRQQRVDLAGAECGEPDDAAIRNAIAQLAWLKKTTPDQIDIRRMHPDFKRAKTIQATAEPDKPLRDDQREFMIGLIRKHPNAASKIGDGISTIRVTSNPQGRGKFILTRADGTEDELSLMKCFDYLTPSLPSAQGKKQKNTASTGPTSSTTAPGQEEPVTGRIVARSAKIAIAMRRDQFPDVRMAEGPEAPDHVLLTLRKESITITATIGRKSFRKAQKTLAENPGNAFIVVQGTLTDKNTIEGAGLVVQPSQPRD